VAGALYKQCAELGKWIRARFVRKVLIDASALSISDWQRRQILYRLDQTQRRSVNRQYRYVRGAIINFLYLLIRNAARFIITLQQSVEQSTTRASCLSFDDMARNTMRCKRLVGEAAAARAARSTAQRAQWARLPQGHLVGSTPICHHHAVLSPERCAAPRPRQSSAVNSSLIRSAEDTGWGEAKIGEGRRPRIRERLLGHDTLTRRDAQCDRFCRPRSKPSHWFSKPTSAAGLSLHRTAVSRCGLQC